MFHRSWIVLTTLLVGCEGSSETGSLTVTGKRPVEDRSSARLPAAPSPVVNDASPSVFAAAPDLQYLTAIAVDQGYLYFTGGSLVPVPQEAPGGSDPVEQSDAVGVLRRAPLSGTGPTEQPWTGQGIGYAVMSNAPGISFVTYDYASRGRTGTVRLLERSGAVRDLAQWRSEESTVKVASDDSAVFWSHSSGANSQVQRTSYDGKSEIVATDQLRLGKLAVRGGDLFWLSGPSVLRTSKTGGPATSIWQGAKNLGAMATTTQWPELVIVDEDTLVAIDTTTSTTRALGVGYRDTRELFFDGEVVYSTNSGDGTVTAFSIADGSRRVLARGQARPGMIVADATSVYWANSGDSTVMIASK